VEERELQQRVQEFIRGFGLLNPDETPCGRPIPLSQAHVLQVLGQSGESTQQALATRLNLDKSTVSRLVAQMVERKLVRKAVNPHNQRECRVALSREGRVVLDEVLEASSAKFRLLANRVPPGKGPQILEALDILNAALRKE
jgi:DNA-binding MarR family transcriptional regulator